jgi:glutamate carboxypeptidase
MTSFQYFEDRLPEYLGELRALVELETPSGDLHRIRAAADFLTAHFEPLGELHTTELDRWGPMLRFHRPGTGSRVLLLAHYDTVWPAGSWPQRWIVADDRISGPGVYDMKSGLLMILWMLRYLSAHRVSHPEIEVLLNPDEEIGSLGSWQAIIDSARQADAVLVLEPTVSGGGLKVARKGAAEFVLEIIGRSSHQGADPERGVNAVIEGSRQVLELLKLENEAAGTTIGPNVMRGGTVSNAVADHCEIRIDVRTWRNDECERISKALETLEPFNPAARLRLGGGWNRPPLQLTDASHELFDRARAIGRSHGLEIEPLSYAGSSDANLAASAGTPTIDGFGAMGAGSHDREEHIVPSDLPTRMALLTDLVASLALPPGEWLSAESLAGVARAKARPAFDMSWNHPHQGGTP